MDKTPPIDDKIKQTPPAEENNLAAQAAAETPAETASAFPPESAKPQKSNKPLIAIAAILLTAIIGGAVWFLTRPQPNSKGESSVETDTPEPDEETAISDQDTTFSLFAKLLALHMPRSKSYLEYAENYTEGKSFEFRGAYTPNEHLYPDASELTNQDKLYIVTSYLKDHDEFEPITNFNVPSNYLATRFADYCSQNSIDSMWCADNAGSAVSEEKVAETYRKFFGTTPTFENPTAICGGSIYDSEYHIFHDSISACGGIDLLNHQLYVSKYTEQGKLAYIYVSLGTINEDYDPSGTTSVYRAYLKWADVWDSNTQQAITPDPSLLHEESLGMTDYGMYITPENYTFFEQYRFVFEKDSDNNYYFKTVEKL